MTQRNWNDKIFKMFLLDFKKYSIFTYFLDNSKISFRKNSNCGWIDDHGTGKYYFNIYHLVLMISFNKILWEMYFF